MIVHLPYRACRLLSFAAYEWLSFKITHHPCLLPGPTTQEGFTRQPIVGMLAHDPLKGPQFPNVFVITLAMMYLYLLLYSYFLPIIEYSSVVHGTCMSVRSVSLVLGQLSVMSRRRQCICWDAMQCSKYLVAN